MKQEPMPPTMRRRRGKPVDLTCVVCGCSFRAKASHADWRKSCGMKCAAELKRVQMTGPGNHQYGLKGELNASWQGGRTISSYGYVRVLCPGHPAANVDGRVFEHRLVMEKHLGRLLKRGEVVHHINENRTDNRIENLELMTLGAHTSMHNREDPMPRGTGGRFVTRNSVQVVEVEELSDTARGAGGFGSSGR